VFCPNVKHHCPEGALINTNFLRTRKDMPLLSDIYACCRLVWCNTCQLQILLKMLPKYYNHVRTYDNTLITIFVGVHRITLKAGRKMHFHILVTLLLFSLFTYAVVIWYHTSIFFCWRPLAQIRVNGLQEKEYGGSTNYMWPIHSPLTWSGFHLVQIKRQLSFPTLIQ
jgi:hypothetical protein